MNFLFIRAVDFSAQALRKLIDMRADVIGFVHLVTQASMRIIST